MNNLFCGAVLLFLLLNRLALHCLRRKRAAVLRRWGVARVAMGHLLCRAAIAGTIGGHTNVLFKSTVYLFRDAFEGADAFARGETYCIISALAVAVFFSNPVAEPRTAHVCGAALRPRLSLLRHLLGANHPASAPEWVGTARLEEQAWDSFSAYLLLSCGLVLDVVGSVLLTRARLEQLVTEHGALDLHILGQVTRTAAEGQANAAVAALLSQRLFVCVLGRAQSYGDLDILVQEARTGLRFLDIVHHGVLCDGGTYGRCRPGRPDLRQYWCPPGGADGPTAAKTSRRTKPGGGLRVRRSRLNTDEYQKRGAGWPLRLGRRGRVMRARLGAQIGALRAPMWRRGPECALHMY